MKRKFFLAAVILSLGLCLAGCYSSDDNGELSTVPVTNNPHVIGDSAKGGMPGIPH